MVTAAPTDKIIIRALSGVRDPERGADIVSLGMVSGLEIADGRVLFSIEVDPARGPALEPLRLAAERAVAALPGVEKVTAVLTAQRPASASSSSAMDPHGMGKNPRLVLPVRHIVAVASGKGGVGKSTVAANLAVALAGSGLSAGLLDADVYGPSAPTIMGIAGNKPKQDKGGILQPVEAHGVKVMSMGFLVEAEKPVIWRGPMAQSAVYQLLRDVAWGSAKKPLDILVVDMPPGTGDVQLTLAQKVPLAGAVIVSTPQDIALIDARKGLEMFRAVNVPVLGIIENMSLFVCPNCGHEAHIFGHGGAREQAKKLGVPFLGEIPLNADLREMSDRGRPVTAAKTDNPCAAAFRDIAGKIRGVLAF